MSHPPLHREVVLAGEETHNVQRQHGNEDSETDRSPNQTQCHRAFQGEFYRKLMRLML